MIVCCGRNTSFFFGFLLIACGAKSLIRWVTDGSDTVKFCLIVLKHYFSYQVPKKLPPLLIVERLDPLRCFFAVLINRALEWPLENLANIGSLGIEEISTGIYMLEFLPKLLD